MIKIKERLFEPYISEHEILERVASLARNIENDYASKEPLFLAVLNGSFMFMADLTKAINMAVGISFIKIASYQGLHSTGNVKEMIGITESVEGRDIIIVEDIVDSGKSMAYLLKMLQRLHPKSIEIASLLLKPTSLRENFHIKYLGFEIPDFFVVGYGLDFDGFGRNLNQIYRILQK
ncbi:MAG: hypoxanthine phosphoribosyltransferase [Cyclobacteriaceae bacterium]